MGVFGAEEQIDDALLIIRNTIHKTIMGDYTLGLDFVINTEAGDVEAPAVDIDGDVPGATMDIVFVVSYRTPYTHLGVK
ncbi:hypothetical protein JCM19232_2641 [Vibrio ishigakensis]|uniref:Uncharacterized protein n=1 Tax=Vibrio ishigakensis TaxID=1481914 RepID=A0A0B8PBA3_9VIBR|nr:hypothetical protein JCM19232_2641 [Vibrio ishigakensis]